MLRLPVFGDLVLKSTIARWTRTLATMFAAGVPLVEALDSVGGASGNYVYLMATKQIQKEVSTRHLADAGDAELRRVPEHGAADVLDRRGDRRAGRDARQGRRLLRGRGGRRGRGALLPDGTDDHGGAGHADRRHGDRHVPADLQDGPSGLDGGLRLAGPACRSAVGRPGLRPVHRLLPERRHPSPAEDDGARVARAVRRTGGEAPAAGPRALQGERITCWCRARPARAAAIASRRWRTSRSSAGSRCAASAPPAAARSPPRYPIVELLAGAIAAYAAWRYGPSLAALGAMVFGWALLALTVIDLDTQLLPDDITLPLAVGGPAGQPGRHASRRCAPR